jgi:hypothetical protein
VKASLIQPNKNSMSDRRQRRRSIKREREEAIDLTRDTTPVLKRQRRQEPHLSMTAQIKSDPAAINAPEAVIKAYQHILGSNLEAIAFLFSSAFGAALKVPAERVASDYHVTTEEAIEELRRLLAIKAFAVDTEATKISPTPLSTQTSPASYLFCANLP